MSDTNTDQIKVLVEEIEDDTTVLPDLFITHTKEEGVKVYSNNPDAIGRIIVFEPLDDSSFANEINLYSTDAEMIVSDADDWEDELSTCTLDLKTFLEKFIERNT